MNEISWPAIAAIMAVMSGIGSAIGVYVGMKVGLVRLETWRDITVNDIRDLKGDMSVAKDDLLVHDIEIEDLFREQGWDRAVRQRVRR